MLSAHDRQSKPSSAPEVNPPGGLLTIGELARRAGVSASAVRYYEELGLLPPPARVSGQRRYHESATRLVAAILLYSDAGFTLAEQKALIAPRDGTPGWRQLARRKIAELDEQIARAQAAREAISHGLRCPHEDITQCPNFKAGVTARLNGQPLSQSHQQLHAQESRLVGHLRDALGDGAGSAERDVHAVKAPGKDRTTIAYALVLGVRGGAHALACAPVPGEGRAQRLHSGAGGRVEFLHGLGGRRRYLLAPFAERGRGGVPRRRELSCRAARVIPHVPSFSLAGRCGQRGPSPGRPSLVAVVAAVQL
jgi:DNA-binding transcriptional MerR regulator